MLAGSGEFRRAVAASPSSRPSVEDRLAADSLLHSAASLGRLPKAAGRTGRIVVLLEYAHRLWPGDAGINRQRLEIYEGSGEMAKAAEAADECVRADKDDYALAGRWIGLSESLANTAEDRITFLEKVVADSSFPAAVRALAVAELADVYRRQGDVGKAKTACRQALALDPYQPLALREQGQLSPQGDPVEAFHRSLALLAGNPRSLQVAWEVARRLQAAGEYDTALRFYEHALALAEASPPASQVLQAILVDYANALLDSGRTEKAVEFLEPMQKTYELSLPLRALLVEALRPSVLWLTTSRPTSDQATTTSSRPEHIEERLPDRNDGPAAVVVGQMQTIYRLTEATSRPTGTTAAELAWFYLMFAHQKERALNLIQQGVVDAERDTFVRRVLGATLIALGRGEDGARMLSALASKDPYAAAILARYYYENKQADAAAKALLAPAGAPRTGPGWRALTTLAAEHHVVIPPSGEAGALRDAIKDFPLDALEIGRRPEKFVRIRLVPVKASLACGEPVELAVELENISKQPVPLGQWGVFNPNVLLSLNVEGKATATIPNLVAVVLPAPRYLQPGQRVRQVVRLDVGQAQELLATGPLAELKLTVSATVDPLQQRDRMVSAVPQIKVEPATIRREQLLSPMADRQAAMTVLGGIVRDLKKGDLATQMRAARQTAALLAYVRLGETGKAKLMPRDVLDKPVLLSMTRAFLQAPSAAVRAEMATALEQVELDESIISLLDPGDVSPLVRLRMIGLLASKRTPGYRSLAGAMAADEDPLVRAMATAASRD